MSVPTEPFTAIRISRQARFTVPAPPSAVFPLLCPVREREWIPGWQAEVLFSESGVNEDLCIFTSPNPLLGEGTYVTSRFEQDRLVEFTVFYPGLAVMKLEIVLLPGAGASEVVWTRRYTGLSSEGNQRVAQVTEEAFAKQMEGLVAALEAACLKLG